MMPGPSVREVDESSFVEFYRREHAGQVRRAALLLGSDELANDVVHDAMIEVLRRWPSIDHPGAYLNRAVLNGCRDVARQASVRRRLAVRLTDPAACGYSEIEVLDDVLAALPFNQRAAVVLRYYVGLSIKEIGDELGCAPGSPAVWIERALKKMREKLQ